MFGNSKIHCVTLWFCVVASVNVRKKKIVLSADIPNDDVINLPKITHDGWEDPCFYPSMDSLLEVWRKSVAQFQKGSKSLVSLFINKCFTSPTSWDDKNADKNRKPFINIEGTSQTLRDEVARSLNRALKGQFLENPPKCMIPVRYIYGSRMHELHRPYLALGAYGSSHSVKAYWVRKPVLMTGYWYDITSTTLTDLFLDQETPPDNSSIYVFPKDLIRPDLLVFINSLGLPDSWEEGSQEDKIWGSPRWQIRYTDIFMKFPNSVIHEVKWNGAANVTETILQLIQDQLGERFQLPIK